MTKDKAFFTQKIQECENKIYRLALGILRNEADAADAMQDAILKAWVNFDSLRDRKSFEVWMLTIVHNCAVEVLKKRHEWSDIDECYELAADEDLLDRESKMTLWQAVENLERPYRTVVVLFYYDGCSVKEISSVTGSSAAAVRQQLTRARKMLASMLDRKDFEI